MSAVDARAAAMVTAADPGRTRAFYAELQAAGEPASLAAAIAFRLDPLIEAARDDVETCRRLLQEAQNRIARLQELAAAAEAVALGGRPDDTVLLRGRRIADAAIRVAREHDRSELHYREWFDLVRDAGYLIGGADPQASFLTALHRHPDVEPVGVRTGVWRIPGAAA